MGHKKSYIAIICFLFVWNVTVAFAPEGQKSRMTGLLKEVTPTHLVVQNENGVFKFVKNKSKVWDAMTAQVGKEITVEYILMASKVVVKERSKTGGVGIHSETPDAQDPFENRIQDDRIFYETFDRSSNKLPGISVAKAACRRTKILWRTEIYDILPRSEAGGRRSDIYGAE